VTCGTKQHTTPDPPVVCRPCRLAPDRLAVAKSEFEAMLLDGTARHAEGPGSSAHHFVPKNSGWRDCGEPRCSERPPNFLPALRSSHQCYAHHLFGCSIFSKIHLVRVYLARVYLARVYLARVYHQIPVHPDNIHKTAIPLISTFLNSHPRSLV
jgi:hypothetical protein